MSWKIPLSDVDFGNEEVDAVRDVVKSGWVTLGREVRTFEAEFAEAMGAEGAVAMANCTAALHLACFALGTGPDTEVIVPTLSFVASANAVALAGGVPVLVDSSGPEDLTLDPARVTAAVTDRTVGVMAMHYGGYPCDMGALTEITGRSGLFLVEDAAHAPGARYGGKPIGTLGDAGCFSFFGNKNMTTGEGGMVLARDPEVLEKVRLLRSHGMTTLSWDRFAGHAWEYDVLSAGFNYRPTELMGALGRIQLGKLERNNERRNKLIARYRAALRTGSGVALPFGDRIGAGHLCALLVENSSWRDPLRKSLAEAGIQTSLHYPPIHLFRHYREQGYGPGDFPVAEDIAARAITLPLYPGLSESQVDEVSEHVLRFARERHG